MRNRFVLRPRLGTRSSQFTPSRWPSAAPNKTRAFFRAARPSVTVAAYGVSQSMTSGLLPCSTRRDHDPSRMRRPLRIWERS